MAASELTIGFKCRIKKVRVSKGHSNSWNKDAGNECIITERSGFTKENSDFAIMTIGKGPNAPTPTDGSVYYGESAWIPECQLELVDKNIGKNLMLVAWMKENEERYCPYCLAFNKDYPKIDTCPKCGCEW